MLWWVWGLVVLGSAIFLGWILWKLVIHKAWPTLREIESFAEDFSARWEAASQGRSQPLRTPTEPAIFSPVSATRAAYTRSKEQRQTARMLRRMQRKDALGQPQRVSDLRKAERKGLHYGSLI